MWAGGYSPVALSPLRAPVEPLYLLTPLARAPSLIPMRTVRLPNYPADPQFVSSMIIGQQIVVASRSGTFPLAPVILHSPTPVALPRPVELVPPTASNVVFQSYGPEVVNFPVCVRQPMDSSVMAVDGSAPVIITPPPMVVSSANCNISLPTFSSVSCISPCGLSPVLQNHLPVDPVLSPSHPVFISAFQSSACTDSPCAEAMVPDIISDAVAVDDECSSQQLNFMDDFQAPEFASDALSDYIATGSLSFRPDSPESISSRVPLYERTGIQSPDLIPPISTGTNEPDVIDLSESMFESDVLPLVNFLEV